jgi:predicted negative regulator of RcsB-dependent stress response
MRELRSSLPMIMLFVCCMISSGCGESQELPADKRQKSQQAFEKATEAFSQKDFSAAEVGFSEALANGGLNGDQFEEAHVKLAVAMAASNKFGEAMSTLAKIEQGSTIPDQILAAKSFILAKQGKTAESHAAWAQAVRYNRSVQKFGN